MCLVLKDGGSADTTTATMSTFLLNMVLHPEVQEKAWAEIERVTGNERLPEFAEYVLFFALKPVFDGFVSRLTTIN